jgi:DNA topoisomerase-1
MEKLRHNGVLVPKPYKGQGLTVKVRGETIHLTEEQEERAIAWAKKIGTPYVEDTTFAENFHEDLSEILGIKVLPVDIDYSTIHQLVLDEREQRANLSREERKALAAERKAVREANKEKYGWATVDGESMEIGNYTVEPSSIFMGRGQHPMRGRWKKGPRHEDIELNLSPDAPRPPGNWKTIVWEPDTMWIARWRDKLSGKIKYVWPHDSSPLKQRKDIEKFDKALDLRKQLNKVKRHIDENLEHVDPLRKKTATVTFLIDHCKFRVGDEKDDEEETTASSEWETRRTMKRRRRPSARPPSAPNTSASTATAPSPSTFWAKTPSATSSASRCPIPSSKTSRSSALNRRSPCSRASTPNESATSSTRS